MCIMKKKKRLQTTAHALQHKSGNTGGSGDKADLSGGLGRVVLGASGGAGTSAALGGRRSAIATRALRGSGSLGRLRAVATLGRGGTSAVARLGASGFRAGAGGGLGAGTSTGGGGLARASRGGAVATIGTSDDLSGVLAGADGCRTVTETEAEVGVVAEAPKVIGAAAELLGLGGGQHVVGASLLRRDISRGACVG
ncbi:hypothetical protein BM221_001624 [Beauveria bassiana]|uniref:Uncharacterized protein n=1 Tax=Beauveria bassiana TaxID=176275 RepID=A0A2N6NW94_BEABA|nr:hypothetical protein BM221_001624 [Beauveria bassiana]